MITTRGSSSSAERRGDRGVHVAVLVLVMLLGGLVLDAGTFPSGVEAADAAMLSGHAAGASAYVIVVRPDAPQAVLEFAVAEHFSPVTAAPIPDETTPVPTPDAAPAIATDNSAAAPVVIASVPDPHSAANLHARGMRALASMPVTPDSLGFTISFDGRSGHFGGLMHPTTRHIDVFIDPQWSDGELRHVVAHEIGHAFDLLHNDVADRRAWRSHRRIPMDGRWWSAPFQPDFASPSGDFAECFAAWAVGSASTNSAFGDCAGSAGLVAALVHG